MSDKEWQDRETELYLCPKAGICLSPNASGCAHTKLHRFRKLGHICWRMFRSDCPECVPVELVQVEGERPA